jgi:CubicO group peptidase (beta-lactamase class C family)
MNSLRAAAVLMMTLPTVLFAQDPAETIAHLMAETNKIGVFNGNILVGYRRNVVYTGSFGYADPARSARLAADYAFYIGSISKEFNGAGILLLEQRRMLRLEDRVSRYLTGYPSWADTIKIGQLIDYTSGLPDLPDDSDAGMHESLLKLKALKFAPGTAYLYSNANVFLQKKIIERLTGLTYGEFLKTQIFGPCNMTNVQDESGGPLKVALPFTNTFTAVDFDITKNLGALAAAEDLYHWMECVSDASFLSGPSLEKLGKSFGTGESSLGSAQFRDGVLSTHEHQGSGYNNEALVYGNVEEGIIIVLVTNNQNFKLHQLKDAILAILHGQPYSVPRKSIYLDIREGLAANFEDGIAAYHRLRQTGKDTYDFANEPFDLFNTGKYLLRRHKFDDAIAVLEIGTTFPLKSADLSYGYELIAGAWSEKGNRAMAILYCERALDTDPSNKNARGLLDELNRK